MPSTVFYSSTADGIVRSISTVYATSRAGTGTIAIVNAGLGTQGLAFGQALIPADYYTWQSFLAFDTSSIPDGATITSAELSIYIDTDGSGTDFTTNAYISNWGGTLETTDFVAGASLSGLTKVASLSSAGISVGAHNAFADIALPANVSKTGTTYILLASANQETNTAPSGTEYMLGNATEASGTANDPKLTVNWVFNVPLGKVTETDTVGAMTTLQTFPLAKVSETDTAQAMTARKRVTIGLTTETDTVGAMALSRVRRQKVGLSDLRASAGATQHELTIPARSFRATGSEEG